MSVDSPPDAAGFFATLVRAHALIEERLQELERAADVMADPSRAPAALQAMSRVLEFFSTFGEQHQADEEKTLFPRLRGLPAFAQMLGAFDFQHEMAVTEQNALAARIRGFAPGSEREVSRLAHRFVEVQRAHILAEERALFPLAEQKLSRSVLEEMSRELRTPNS